MGARRWITVDTVITLVVLAVFVAAALQARAWPFRTALFPMLTALTMIGIAIGKLVLDARRRAPRTSAVHAIVDQELVDEDEAEESELEDVFATASLSRWAGPLAWLAGFFVLLWVAGLLVSVPVFAFLYLRLVSRERPLVCAIYAVVSWAFIFGLFDQLLHVPLPTGAVLGVLGG